MAVPLTLPNLITFLNDNADRYKNAPEADGYNSTAAIAAQLTKREFIPNPTPQPDVPKPDADKAATLEAMFAPALLASFTDEALVQIQESLDQNDFKKIRRWAKVGQARGKINAAQLAAIEAELDAQVPDPNWQAEVLDDCECQKQFGENGIAIEFINTALGR